MSDQVKPCEKFVEGQEKPYICATCGGEQHLHPGACDHCGGHRTAPDGWALRQGFTPCPFCAPVSPDTLDFEKATRDALARLGETPDSLPMEEQQRCGFYVGLLLAETLQAQHTAALDKVRKEEREKMTSLVEALIEAKECLKYYVADMRRLGMNSSEAEFALDKAKSALAAHKEAE